MPKKRDKGDPTPKSWQTFGSKATGPAAHQDRNQPQAMRSRADGGRSWDESKHPRKPTGTEAGGEFASAGSSVTGGQRGTDHGLPAHETVSEFKTVNDLGKTWHSVGVTSAWRLGHGSKLSLELKRKKAALEKLGWHAEPGTRGGNKYLHFSSPVGYTKDQAEREFRSVR